MNNRKSPLKFFRTRPSFTYFVIALIGFSCTVKLPVSSIYATNNLSKDLVPWPEFVDENDNHRIRVTAMENIDQMLLFEVEVTNKNQDSLYISPQDWQLDYMNNYDSSVDSTSFPLTGIEINNAYQDIANRIKNARDGTIALVVVGIAVVVVVAAIAAGSGNDNGSNSASEAGSSTNLRNNDFNFCLNIGFGSYAPPQTDEWTTKQKIAYYRQRGQMLQGLDMGPQVILKGETRLFGFFFPRKESAKLLGLKGFIDDTFYTWDFEHHSEGMRKIMN